MIIDDEQFKKLLLENDCLTPEQLAENFKNAQTEKMPLFEYLVERKIIDQRILFNILANFLKISLANFKADTIGKDVLFLIPEPIARAHEIVAFEKTEAGIKIATTDPTDLQTIEFIKKRLGENLIIHLATPSLIKEALKQYHNSLESEFKSLNRENPGENNEPNLAELAKDVPIVRVVDTLLEYAIFAGASDIHIEPAETAVSIRYRIDGILKEAMSLPKTLQSGLTARIKVLANLKLDEHRLPQDGRFKIETGQNKFAFRVSTIPVFDGEKIALRLLDEANKQMTLENLGLQEKPLELLKNAIKKPHGIIYVTGPTGSGKTTTLYTIMNVLNKPEVNISTIEDPIEYRMPGINQSQVNPKIDFTFAKGLRALLRQDPDIIMVGEIRDKETADIAIHAAMTGHLVLSTVHTNDVASTPQRLINMGIPSFLIASTTNLIMAQRLVRKVCKNCIYSYNLEKTTLDDLNKNFNLEKIFDFLRAQKIISEEQKSFASLLFYRGKGCKKCGQTGYKGRVGIYEILEVTSKIEDLIVNKQGSEPLAAAAFEQGMISLTQDGFTKALTGITSIEEVLRVIQE